jgi:hypothetical protein
MDCPWLDRYAFGLNGFRQRLHRVGRSIHMFVDVERRKLSAVATGCGYSAPDQGERA